MPVEEPHKPPQLSLNSYQQQAAELAVYPGVKTAEGLIYTALGLNGEAGEFADQVKKMLRDDDGHLLPERQAKLEKELGDVLWYVSMASREIARSLQEIAQVNLKKLQDRRDREALKGDGDER